MIYKKSVIFSYEGTWIDDKIYGRGKITFNNGDIFEGNWQYDRSGQPLFNGDGHPLLNGSVSVSRDKYKYEGNMVDGRKQGRGKETQYMYIGLRDTQPDVHIQQYDGEWSNDKKNGNGVLTGKRLDTDKGKIPENILSTGIENPDYKYEGSFRNNSKDGHGIYYKVEKGTFVPIKNGNWEDDLFLRDKTVRK
jgi:hypothetical protein